MDLGFADGAVLVSGGSRGIGLAVARVLLAEGARVALAARGRAGLDEAVSALDVPGRVAAVAADTTTEAGAALALDRAEAEFGPLSAVVSVVGGGAGLRGHAVPAAEWHRMVDLNLIGPMTLAARAIDRLAPRRGSLTFVSSIAGCEALDAPVPYAAAKAGLNAAVKALARSAAPLGVRVNAVAPGNVLVPGGTWERRLGENPDAVAQLLAAEVPLGRLADPAEIARVIAFLASGQAGFVTGAVWTADGGQTRGF